MEKWSAKLVYRYDDITLKDVKNLVDDTLEFLSVLTLTGKFNQATASDMIYDWNRVRLFLQAGKLKEDIDTDL